jgi:hypothetical protein
VITLKPAEAKAPIFSGGQPGEGNISIKVLIPLEVKTTSPFPTTTLPVFNTGAASERKNSPLGFSSITSPTANIVEDFLATF